jgi:hypothetical protein
MINFNDYFILGGTNLPFLLVCWQKYQKWLLQSGYNVYLVRRMDLVVFEIPARGIDQQISQGGSLLLHVGRCLLYRASDNRWSPLTIFVPVDPSSFPQATHSRGYGNGCVRGGYKDLSPICFPNTLVDAGPTGFLSDMTASRGPWPGPRTGARRGAASATLSPSRIGQTSRTPTGK